MNNQKNVRYVRAGIAGTFFLLAASSVFAQEVPRIDAIFVDNPNNRFFISGSALLRNSTVKITMGEAGMPGDIKNFCAQGSSTAVIVCTFPGGLPPAGDYALTVSTNYPPLARYYETRYNLTLGGVGPQGPTGATELLVHKARQVPQAQLAPLASLVFLARQVHKAFPEQQAQPELRVRLVQQAQQARSDHKVQWALLAHKVLSA